MALAEGRSVVELKKSLVDGLRKQTALLLEIMEPVAGKGFPFGLQSSIDRGGLTVLIMFLGTVKMIFISV